jgi:hypothetical protein
MRMLFGLLITLFAGPAAADHASLMAALPQVLEEVYGTSDVTTLGKDYIRRYNAYLFAGIDGVWIPLSVFGVLDEANFESECSGRFVVRITRLSDYRFSLQEYPDTNEEVEYIYTYNLGNLFSFQADPEKLLKSHAVQADDPRSLGVWASDVANASGISTIYRPAPDMLVFQRNLRQPVVYGRCS